MRPIVQGFATLLSLTLAFPAFAGLGPNGLGPNGLGPNGLGPNGLGPNGLGPNGLGPNGLGPNGLGPNGLGPNGLGPNGLGPNGLDVNGLGPNGLGPNGLGPNGLPVTFYVVEPGYTIARGRDVSAFETWFEADPVAASQYMRYFARCAYDGNTGVAYQDRQGVARAWTGQYGLAMGSVKSAALETLTLDPASAPVLARMTAEEGKWVSACILAHVNTQGTHQYISLRANPPNVEAQAALALSVGELWTMSDYHGAFFGDLFAPVSATSPVTPKYSCVQHGDSAEAALLDIVLGRSCDSGSCLWTNGNFHDGILHQGRCGDLPLRVGEVMNPLYAASGFALDAQADHAGTFRPILVNGPSVVQFEFPPLPGWSSPRFSQAHQMVFPGGQLGTADAADSGIITPLSSDPFDLPPLTWTAGPSQTVPCKNIGACSYAGSPVGYARQKEGWKLVGLRAGQTLEGVVRYTGHVTNTASGAIHITDGHGTPIVPIFPTFDPNPKDPAAIELIKEFKKPFTAIIRYSNCATAPASATLSVSGPAGMGAPVGTDIWPSTIPDGATACPNGENFTWLQVYPVYGFVEDSGPIHGPRPTLKLSVSGTTLGKTCTALTKGDGEKGSCLNLRDVFFDWKHLKVACQERSESLPVCSGELILDYRNRKWGWFCAYGGPATQACTETKAPELDAFAFIPGKPYCMPDDATSFVGVCK